MPSTSWSDLCPSFLSALSQLQFSPTPPAIALFSASSSLSLPFPAATMSKSFTAAEVAKHKTDKDGLYIIIDGGVYDITGFVDEHPGGPKILKRMAGRDASKAFWKYHSAKVLDKYAAQLKIGTVGEAAKL